MLPPLFAGRVVRLFLATPSILTNEHSPTYPSRITHWPNHSPPCPYPHQAAIRWHHSPCPSLATCHEKAHTNQRSPHPDIRIHEPCRCSFATATSGATPTQENQRPTAILGEARAIFDSDGPTRGTNAPDDPTRTDLLPPSLPSTIDRRAQKRRATSPREAFPTAHSGSPVMSRARRSPGRHPLASLVGRRDGTARFDAAEGPQLSPRDLRSPTSACKHRRPPGSNAITSFAALSCCMSVRAQVRSRERRREREPHEISLLTANHLNERKHRIWLIRIAGKERVCHMQCAGALLCGLKGGEAMLAQ